MKALGFHPPTRFHEATVASIFKGEKLFSTCTGRVSEEVSALKDGNVTKYPVTETALGANIIHMNDILITSSRSSRGSLLSR